MACAQPGARLGRGLGHTSNPRPNPESCLGRDWNPIDHDFGVGGGMFVLNLNVCSEPYKAHIGRITLPLTLTLTLTP